MRASTNIMNYNHDYTTSAESAYDSWYMYIVIVDLYYNNNTRDNII